MNTRKTSSRPWRHFVLTPLALALACSGAAHGAEYWLCAKSTSVAMPGNVSVPMWGYALDASGFAGNCAAPATVPGPPLIVPPGEGLKVHLRNAGLPEPVSLVIASQAMPTDAAGTATLAPVKFLDAQQRQRVRSFTAEAAPGATQSYAWNNLQPGTYLYHSGTHPQVQVQMGLYGALSHDQAAAGAGPAQAYAGVPYQNQVTLLFSEIDPALHAAVAAGQYGPGLAMSSTIDYAPTYFLINGAPHTSASLPLPAGSAGQSTLVRLLNAGLQTRSPVLQGAHMRLMAEDGKPYPHAREQYSVFLPALKTVDAVLTPVAAASYPLYDRRLAVTNPTAAGSADGGMLAYLQVAHAPAGTPEAQADSYSINEDTPLSVPPPGVLANDTGSGLSAVLVSTVSHGSLSLQPDGSFSYAPAANFSGADSFSYKASNGTLSSAPASVSLSVNPVNDAPVAANNAYSVLAGATLTVGAPGVLGNDSDADGDALTVVNASALAGLSLNENGAFSYTAPSTTGTTSFTYQASDASASSAPATVTFTVQPLINRAPVAVNDTAEAPVRRSSPPYTPVSLNVLLNDSDPDGNLYPASITIAVAPNKGGTVTVIGNGSSNVTLAYTPKLNFRGTENFSYRVRDSAGATSNIATVRVNVK